MQLCNVVPSQPQFDDMVNVAAVLSRWHLVVLPKDGSGELWRARVFDLVLRSEGKASKFWEVSLSLVSISVMAGHVSPFQVKILSMHPW